MTCITVRGARQHNLREVHLRIEPDELTVLVGRSGSGKSSLAFDTIHAEGRRRYLQAMSHRVRRVADTLPRPDVEIITGLPPTVALRQQHGRAGQGSVGSMTEMDQLLRVLLGSVGTLHCPETGEVIETHTHDTIVARLMELPVGSRLFIEAPVRHGGRLDAVLEEVGRAGFSRVRIDGGLFRLEEVDRSSWRAESEVRVVVDRIRIRADRQDRLYDAVRTATQAGQGVMTVQCEEDQWHFADRPVSRETGTPLPRLTSSLFQPRGEHRCSVCEGRGRLEEGPCDVCHGSGLGAVALAARWRGLGFVALRDMRVTDLAHHLAEVPREAATEALVEELRRRAGALIAVGLGDVTLSRAAATLSSGEHQRLRLVRAVATELSGVLYVLDEPTGGLDDREVSRVISLIQRLVQRGSGVMVVSHHPDMIRAADRVIEFGPGSGEHGGQIVFDGTPAALLTASSVTAAWLNGTRGLDPVQRLEPDLLLHDVSRYGVELGDVALRSGALNVITGPCASGKTAVLQVLEAVAKGEDAGMSGSRLTGGTFERVLNVVAEGPSRTRRSMPATYIGMWSVIRELLAATTEAQVRGLTASSFSLNVRGGRCEACKGLGEVRMELEFLPDVSVTCEVCEGRRFSRDVLAARWRGLDARALLSLSADEAHPLLGGHPRLDMALRALRDVGLGYVSLGQGLHTLSGGEAQRLGLARELARLRRDRQSKSLFLIDEPAWGLHPEDMHGIHQLFLRLVEAGATVVVATHHRGLTAAAHHVVRLGGDVLAHPAD